MIDPTGAGDGAEQLRGLAGDERKARQAEYVQLSRKLYLAGQEYRAKEKLAREIQAATAPQYADLGGAKETFIDGVEGAAYMGTLWAQSLIPYVGTGLMYGNMYASTHSEMVNKAVYEYGVDPRTAELIATPFSAASAYIERLQIKGLDPKIAPYIADPKFVQLMGKRLGETAVRALGQSAHYGTQFVKNRALVTAQETAEEWIQEDINFAFKATLKAMAKADGIDLGREWEEGWDKKWAAARSMPVAVGLGGGGIQGARAVKSGLTGGGLKGALRELAPPEAGANWGDMRLDPETYASVQQVRIALRDLKGERIPQADVQTWRKYHDSEAFSETMDGPMYNGIDDWMQKNGYDPETDRTRFENEAKFYDALVGLKQAEFEELKRTHAGYELNPDDVPLPLDGDPFWGAADPIIEQVAEPMGFEVHRVDTMEEAKALDPSLEDAPDFNGVAFTQSGKAVLVKEVIERTAKSRGVKNPHGMAYIVAKEEIVGHLLQAHNPKRGGMKEQLLNAVGVDGLISILPPEYAGLADNMRKGGASDAEIIDMLTEEVLDQALAKIDLRKVDEAREGGSIKQRLARFIDDALGTKSTAQLNSDLLLDLVREASGFAGSVSQNAENESQPDLSRTADTQTSGARIDAAMDKMDSAASAVDREKFLKDHTGLLDAFEQAIRDDDPDKAERIAEEFITAAQEEGNELAAHLPYIDLNQPAMLDMLVEHFMQAGGLKKAEAQQRVAKLTYSQRKRLTEAIVIGRPDAVYDGDAPRFSLASEFDAVEPVAVSVDVFGTFEPGTALKVIREAVNTWGDENGLFGSHDTPALNGKVRVTKRKVRNAISHGSADEKTAMLSKLPELLQTAVLVESAPTPGNDQLMTHILASKAVFSGGKSAVAGLVVHEDVNGRVYYDHEMSEIKNEEDETRSGLRSIRSAGASPSHVMETITNALGVKPDVRFSIADVSAAWKKRGIETSVSERENLIVLDKIKVPEGQRGEGLGTKAMQELVNYADRTDKTIALTPSTDFGASSSARLKAFYKRFGFVENKGRAADYEISESMYREPKDRVRYSQASRMEAPELTKRILAGHIYQGRGADAKSARAILRGLKAEVPKKKELEALIDDAKAIAAEIEGEREKIISDRDLSRFINNAADRAIFQRRMQEIEKRYFEGGAGWMEAQQKHALHLEAHAELLKRARQGMDIGEIADALGFNLADLMKRLDADYEAIRAEREEAKANREKYQPKEEEAEEEQGTAPNAETVEQVETDREPAKEPAEKMLWRIADRVAAKMHQEGLTKHKNTKTAMRDPWVLAEYQKTLGNMLNYAVSEQTFGPARERLRMRIQGLEKYTSFKGLRNAAKRILEDSYEARANEDIQAGIDTILSETKKFSGRIKSRQADIRREVTARAIQFYKMIRGGKIDRTEYEGALLMEPEAVEQEMGELNTFIADPESHAPNHLSEAELQQLVREKTDRRNVLMRFGALKHKGPAEVAEAVDWLQNHMTAAIEAQEKLRHEQEVWAGGVISKLRAVLPNRMKGRQSAGLFRDQNSRTQFLEFRLKGLTNYGKGAAREAALKEMDALAFEFGRASFRKNAAVAQDNAAFGQALLEIYADPSSVTLGEAREQIDRHKAAAILRGLMKKRDEYARFSKNGRALSKANLLQIVGMMAQEDYRKIALMQLELEDYVNNHGGTTAEIAESLWQTPDEWIKWKSVHGYELNADQLVRLVASIRTAPNPERVKDEEVRRKESEKYHFGGALLARRLEMVPEIEQVLSVEDIKLLNWLRNHYRENRAEISAMNEKITGLPFPVSPDAYYIPAKIDFERGGISGFTLTMPLVPPGLTPRTFNTRDLDEEADIVELYMQRLEENQQFMHFAELYLKIQSVFNDSGLKTAMENTHGKNYVNQLMVHMRDVISGKPNKGDSAQDKILDSITNYMATTRLGFNVSLFPRQVTSLPAFAMYVDLGKAMKYVMESGTADGRETMKQMLQHPYVKARLQQGHTQVERELYEGLGEKGLSFWELYKRLGRIPTKYGDIIPTLLFGQGYYRALLESEDAKDMREAEAKEWAMDRMWGLVEMSQQSGLLINLAEWQRHGGSYARALGQFISTPQQFWAKQTFDWRELWAAAESEGWGAERTRKAGLQLTKTAALNHLVLPLLYNGMKLLWNAMLGDRPDDDDWHNMFMSMLIGPFAGIYILGAAIEGTLKAGIEGKLSWGDSVIPASAVYQDADHLAVALNHLLHGDPAEMLAEIDALLRGVQPIYRDTAKALENYGGK